MAKCVNVLVESLLNPPETTCITSTRVTRTKKLEQEKDGAAERGSVASAKTLPLFGLDSAHLGTDGPEYVLENMTCRGR